MCVDSDFNQYDLCTFSSVVFVGLFIMQMRALNMIKLIVS